MLSLGDAARLWGALDAIERIEMKIDNLGGLMATAAEQITALSVKVDALAATTADIHADFTAFKDAMEAERENLTAAGQAALDAASAKLDTAQAALGDLDVAVGDADGSDTPV
jgi:peptidoglycan hydrolase CwlO-like protein